MLYTLPHKTGLPEQGAKTAHRPKNKGLQLGTLAYGHRKLYNRVMLLNSIIDTLLLLALGLFGWLALAKLRFPAPEVLGPAILIGALRLMQVDLPTSPSYIFPVVQIMIGIFIGSMLNKDSVSNLKPIALAASIIVAWALAVILVIGFLLSHYSALDLYTALLSVSMGGLPEITIIGLASGAGIAVIVTAQMLRLLITIFIFPVILNRIKRQKRSTGSFEPATLNDRPDLTAGFSKPERPGSVTEINANQLEQNQAERGTSNFALMGITRVRACFKRENISAFFRSARMSWFRILITIAVASAGGLLFYALRIPAGLMVGSTVFIAVASVFGLQLSRLSPWLFNLLLVLIGISIADNITIEAVSTLSDITLILPIIFATVIIFASSFAVSHLICRMTGWDYPSCFLAAAPGGFTMMTALAVQYNIDPFRVSMLHLARLLAIKLSLPVIFMFLMNR